VLQTEKSFAEMSLKEGIPAAFMTYADERAVSMRDNQLIKGKDAIRAYYDRASFQHAWLEWTPDFVEVSSSGDLAYTYGHYRFYSVDSTGIRTLSSGIFHTVWKKKENGSWRYVWD
jgi:ketosteroid isomerase-like protein